MEPSSTVVAAAANQADMPALLTGVDYQNTPDGRINEKVQGSFQRDTMAEKLQQEGDQMSEKLRRGDGSVNEKLRQGKLQQGREQSLLNLDDRVERKMNDGYLDSADIGALGIIHEDGKRKSMKDDDRRRSEAEKGMSNKTDVERTDTDVSDEEALEDLVDWLGRPLDSSDVIDAEVSVDKGGALQATLALEEELKQAVDAGAIKTLDEIEAEELEEALKEEDSRLKKYWKKFALFGIIVAIAVGVGVGLTRGQANEVSILELEDICNYTNTRAPWLRSAVSSILCRPNNRSTLAKCSSSLLRHSAFFSPHPKFCRNSVMRRWTSSK